METNSSSDFDNISNGIFRASSAIRQSIHLLELMARVDVGNSPIENRLKLNQALATLSADFDVAIDACRKWIDGVVVEPDVLKKLHSPEYLVAKKAWLKEHEVTPAMVDELLARIDGFDASQPKDKVSADATQLDDFVAHADGIIELLAKVAETELTETQFLLAKSTVLTAFGEGQDPTSHTAIKVWESTPELREFAAALRESQISVKGAALFNPAKHNVGCNGVKAIKTSKYLTADQRRVLDYLVAVGCVKGVFQKFGVAHALGTLGRENTEANERWLQDTLVSLAAVSAMVESDGMVAFNPIVERYAMQKNEDVFYVSFGVFSNDLQKVLFSQATSQMPSKPQNENLELDGRRADCVCRGWTDRIQR